MFLLTSLRAEYHGYHIKFRIENVKGQISKGYISIYSGDIDQDSLSNTHYLKKSLVNRSWTYDYKKDSLTYFKEILKYEFNPYWDSSGKKQPLYYLANKKTISFKSIKNLRIDEIIKFGTLIGIANGLKPSDTTWMKNEPIERIIFDGYLLHFQIFIHENSPKLNEIIKQLERKQDKLNSIKLQDENGNTDNAAREKIDDDLWNAIQKLNGLRVVVIVGGG